TWASVRGSNFLTSSPLAGLMVAMAIVGAPCGDRAKSCCIRPRRYSIPKPYFFAVRISRDKGLPGEKAPFARQRQTNSEAMGCGETRRCPTGQVLERPVSLARAKQARETTPFGFRRPGRPLDRLQAKWVRGQSRRKCWGRPKLSEGRQSM